MIVNRYITISMFLFLISISIGLFLDQYFNLSFFGGLFTGLFSALTAVMFFYWRNEFKFKQEIVKSIKDASVQYNVDKEDILKAMFFRVYANDVRQIIDDRLAAYKPQGEKL